MKKDSRRYIVVTPCRNEEKNIPNLVQSMTAQTIRPALWVIVDDGSTDKTGEIIKEAEKQHEWIKGVYLEEHKEYLGAHYAYVCNKGFEYAKEKCNEKGIPYAYIALVDSDNILEREYFEKLINEFENEPKLGIASGNDAWSDIEELLKELRKNKKDINVMGCEFWQMYDSPLIHIGKGREDLPIGSARLWRKACFEETGGYANVYAPDSVSNVKAKAKGWKTKRFRDIKIIERKGLTAEGSWNGYKNCGKSDFFLCYPLYLAMLKALKQSLKKPHYSGVAYMLGYIKTLISGEKRIGDVEIRRYYQFIRTVELKEYYKEKVRKVLK